MTTQKTTPAPISTTPASTIDCQDVRSDCRNHLHACEGVFQTWAMTNCARTCGYCYNSPLCEDTADCVHLPSTVCTDPDLQDFAMTSCRKFCRFCNNDTTHSVKMTTQFVPTTTPSASMTSSFTMKIPKTAIP
ncbi:uncharacterized protein LOC125681288 [Ostrea edulis]|uniref:uncharacterized protein LOC125681288 n=1 Tax=Ostrea edulis TaxID=37623 RepID=UPI0024AF92B7|nr:uncharacterized protein LOC125681288 [Ostrea edulis]